MMGGVSKHATAAESRRVKCNVRLKNRVITA